MINQKMSKLQKGFKQEINNFKKKVLLRPKTRRILMLINMKLTHSS